jgi:ABC-type spermidine/putrescine transport system permease subunit II
MAWHAYLGLVFIKLGYFIFYVPFMFFTLQDHFNMINRNMETYPGK